MNVVPDHLDARFRGAASRSGLLDAGFDVVESPIGPLLIAATPVGLLRISFTDDPDAALDELARRAGRRVLRSPLAVDQARGQLAEYFAGERETFTMPLDMRGVAPFTEQVLRELAAVPYGHTATYGELAARAGRPGAARAVGMVMNRNRIPIVLPCHRILGANGSLVGYAGGLEVKERLLRLEGVTV